MSGIATASKAREVKIVTIDEFDEFVEDLKTRGFVYDALAFRFKRTEVGEHEATHVRVSYRETTTQELIEQAETAYNRLQEDLSRGAGNLAENVRARIGSGLRKIGKMADRFDASRDE